MKKAKVETCASTFERAKMLFTAATSGSTIEVMNPQAKNRVVTAANAPVADLVRSMRTPLLDRPRHCRSAGAAQARLHAAMTGDSVHTGERKAFRKFVCEIAAFSQHSGRPTELPSQGDDEPGAPSHARRSAGAWRHEPLRPVFLERRALDPTRSP